MGGSKQEVRVPARSQVLHNVQAEIDRLGLPQSVLARRLDVPEKSVSNWRHGHTVPRYSSVKKIAELVGRDPDWFYQRHSDEEQAA